MSNDLSSNMLNQLFSQNADDPFLMLVTITHQSFDPVYIVNNTEQIVSNGNTFLPLPMRVTLPTDDGETLREVTLEVDNVSLELIDELRSVTDLMDAKVEMVLASNPDFVEISIEELKIRSVTYNKQTIQAKLFMDDFLNTELTSERYSPQNFPGIFS